MKKKLLFAILYLATVLFNNTNAQAVRAMNENHRPLIHFSPKEKWMNDPNGMLFYKGIYHLFFQYYPDSTIWGPMHWGHATSNDLFHWKQQPIALYPDTLGYIFSGSAVADINNTSGLGINGKGPLVAVFTHHDPVGEKSGRNDFQNQSIAYSNDDGKTWVKYAGNPVLKNPGITDFRDPKVMWYEKDKKWIMTLATNDRISFYSSKNLINWKKESEFGNTYGAHGGVWECPDLFPLNDKGKKVWVLIVNLNPGGPNKGSATQYFLGDFNGNKFTPFDSNTKWLDYGPDEYAGITWSNTGDRKIFLGWMSNWLYANVVPTEKWRNAATIPRELALKHVGKNILLTSEPVTEISSIQSGKKSFQNLNAVKNIRLSDKIRNPTFPCRINLHVNEAKDFSLVLSNDINELTIIGYNQKNNQYYIDRTRSGKTGFQPDFAARHVAPRFADKKDMEITLVIDVSSVELFADNGLTVMTSIFFPNKPYNRINIQSGSNISKLEFFELKSILK
jgi:fructan beta-fructosidase